MKQALLTTSYLFSRSLYSSSLLYASSNLTSSSPLLIALTRNPFRFYSLSRESKLARTLERDSSINDEDVSNEELKRRIEKFYEGDQEALPSIFEAILRRKLGGKHEEADQEIMTEIRSRMPKQVEFGSDENGLVFTDEEIDLSDASDTDEEDSGR